MEAGVAGNRADLPRSDITHVADEPYRLKSQKAREEIMSGLHQPSGKGDAFGAAEPLTGPSEPRAVLARLDRLPVWSLRASYLVIIGVGYFFTFFDIADIGYGMPSAVSPCSS